MQWWVCVTIILALALSGCGKREEAPTFAGANLPPDVAGNTAPSAQTAALNAGRRRNPADRLTADYQRRLR